jgi:hypothetical protein
MNKAIALVLLCSVLASSYDYNGSTTAAVTLSAGIIKAQSVNIEKKYKRKDCPVCEGKGWYISGDKITKVNCGYCEPDKPNSSAKVIIHPPVNMSSNCNNGTCTIPTKK